MRMVTWQKQKVGCFEQENIGGLSDTLWYFFYISFSLSLCKIESEKKSKGVGAVKQNRYYVYK